MTKGKIRKIRKLRYQIAAEVEKHGYAKVADNEDYFVVLKKEFEQALKIRIHNRVLVLNR